MGPGSGATRTIGTDTLAVQPRASTARTAAQEKEKEQQFSAKTARGQITQNHAVRV